MLLAKKTHRFQPATLAPGALALLGTQVKIALDTTWPIEEILLFVNVTCSGTGPTLTGADNILGIVRKFNLTVNENNAPRSVVDASGIGLLEYAEKVGLNLDRATRSAVALSQGASIAASQQFRICYRIPLVHPQICQPLRSQMLLPVHTYQQAPVMTIDFEQAGNMYSAGAFSVVSAEYVLKRRNMTPDVTAAIQAKGGFIASDLLEIPYQIPLGYAGEVRFDLPIPGSYANLVFRQYLGGATVTRNVVDQTTTIGQETIWRIESAGVAEHQWKWKDLQTIEDCNGPLNSANQTYSPSFAGAVAASTSFQPASSCYLDFISDGLDGVSELGSVLDANAPSKANLKITLIGNVASVATNPSVIYMLGQKYYGDLSRWQQL